MCIVNRIEGFPIKTEVKRLFGENVIFEVYIPANFCTLAHIYMVNIVLVHVLIVLVR